MSISDSSQTGCFLSEDVRRYYLDIMGIQVWRAVETAVVETESAAAAEGNDSWQVLEQAVSNCMKCGLHTSRTQTVFGFGDKNAGLMIIGEAPGRDEDIQGEPFVGRAGQLLNAMLAAIGLSRDQVYIANILKCRPPNNRDPEPDEAATCSSWLLKQIELLQPDVILVLGRVAAHNLLNTDHSLASLRGRLHKYAGIPVVVSYHPAYLLRKPVDKRKSWQDLKRVKQFIKY